MAESPVFIVYDEGMLAHAHIPHLQKRHPEKPSRIVTIQERLAELGLLERCDCASVAPRAATDAEILLVHSAEHLAEVRSITAEVAAAPLDRELREPDGPGGIYYSPESLASALLAAGCVIEMCHQILRAHARQVKAEAASEEAKAQLAGVWHGAPASAPAPDGSADGAASGSPPASGRDAARMPPCGFALVRPPGHHAGYDDTPGHRAEGFCFFNSVACAARSAIASGAAARVLIVDYDVHHGNGTERLFWEAADVLYMSVHRCACCCHARRAARLALGWGCG